MKYYSTRNKSLEVSASEAITMGLARDGGLFVPAELPKLTAEDMVKLGKMKYSERAVYVMNMFLDEFSEDEIRAFAENAYNRGNFDTPAVAPVKSLDDSTAFLELWHGPTCAFKDMALQMLPHLLTASAKKLGTDKKVCILTATSGDTGKAALEGFKDVPGTGILVFYPRDGVSDVQKLQMVTQEGSNVGVCSVEGNFDDAQTGVKKIFSDEAMREKAAEKGYVFSSANSINWGRLLPQIVYYISAYCDMVERGSIAMGDKLSFCVPTGNFGDILAGYYAKCMGLPVGKLICASNSNNVLTDFINTGVYNKNRTFFTTISPSMDILVSSNLERLIFDLSGKDDALIAGYMKALSEKGVYTVNDSIKAQLDNLFISGCCSDDETKTVISDTYNKYGYLIDTHTAVAWAVLQSYRRTSGDNAPCVVVSTASPFKFCASVLDALGKDSSAPGLELIDRLAAETGAPAPAPLMALKSKQVRFTNCVPVDRMNEAVEAMLV